VARRGRRDRLALLILAIAFAETDRALGVFDVSWVIQKFDGEALLGMMGLSVSQPAIRPASQAGSLGLQREAELPGVERDGDAAGHRISRFRQTNPLLERNRIPKLFLCLFVFRRQSRMGLPPKSQRNCQGVNADPSPP
jgi:hypothetical protein